MIKSMFFAKSFWTSKLGQASLASIAAMTAMVIVTTQVDASDAQVASSSQPQAIFASLIEIA